MLIILTLYLVLALLIFAKLKIIKLGWISEAITAPIEASILWEPSLLPLGDGSSA